MIQPKISVIILNWNGWKDTIECLESLFQADYPHFDVTLVDNASVDESIDNIQKWADGKIEVKSKYFEFNSFNKPIKVLTYAKNGNIIVDKNKTGRLISDRRMTLIKNEVNFGFAEGNNIGIRHVLKNSNPDYILLLNNDTVVNVSALGELIKIAVDDSKLGMVASKLLFYDHPNVINSVGTLIFKDGSAAHRGGKEIDIGQYDQSIETFAPCAAAALYRSEMLKEIGLFDKDFFAYLEDVDLGWRARLNGWKCVFAPKAVFYHKHSMSSKKYSAFKIAQIERNRILVLVKNYPFPYVIFSPLFTIYRYYIMLSVSKHNNTEVAKYSENIGILRIFWTLFATWAKTVYITPKIIIKRKKIQALKKVSMQDIEHWFTDFSINFSKMAEK